jgi:hypothetical protein
MADPSVEQTTSVPVPPTRAARLLKVVADIESIRDSGPLSDDTSAHVEMFLDRARDPSTDIELLEIATMMLKQAQDTKAMASRVREDVARATAGATTGRQTLDGIHLDEPSYPAIAAELDKASEWNKKRSNGDTTAAPAMPELEQDRCCQASDHGAKLSPATAGGPPGTRRRGRLAECPQCLRRHQDQTARLAPCRKAD